MARILSRSVRRKIEKLKWKFIKRRKTIDNIGMSFEFDTYEEYSRYALIAEKEPGTISWIDSFFCKDDVFYDIGANVGTFSFYAASKVFKVLAFEPHFGNYAILNRNIACNHLDEVVAAYCLAFTDKNGFDRFYLYKFSSGSSTSQLGRTVDHNGQSFRPEFSQGMICVTLDYAVGLLPDECFPNHIKIDVDGLEDNILKGATKVLADPRLKSLLVEASGTSEVFIEEMKKLGFVLHRRDAVGSKGDENLIFVKG